MWLLNKISCEIQILNEKVGKLMIENGELEEENRLLKNEIAWLKDHTKYNGITEEYYIDGTMTATEAKLRLQQAEDNQNYVSKLEEENRMLNKQIEQFKKGVKAGTNIIERLEEENEKLKEKLDGGLYFIKFETDLLNKRDKELEELKEENRKLKAELDKIKKRVKEHTNYSVKAEFIKKFGE